MSDLTTILFGTFLPPEAPHRIRSHRCGDKDPQSSRIGYKPSKKPVDADGATDNQAKILRMVRNAKRPITSLEVSERLGFSKSFCNITMLKMCELGKMRREAIKVRDVKAYVYEAI